MRKTFNFGKIAYNGGKKINRVTVDIELKTNEKGQYIFTSSGMVYNSKNTDCVAGGQCLDDLLKYLEHNKIYKEIYEMWKKYHLNDLHAGTQEQENALKNAVKEGILTSYGANNYEATCNYLKSIGLYEVMHEGKSYKYGHGWILYEIPEEDLKKTKALFEI